MSRSAVPSPEEVLKQAFGYGTFRPLQREIIAAAMDGQDVFALLPTGGGKSLCFQLPALLREGLTLVISPLIALMKDQVDQLEATGIPATFLNSSLREAEARARLRGLHEGRYRLLYAAPERLMLESWQENLKTWNVSAIAIDEAHCISEWGHDFRPEYRQIATLRNLLPEVPVMALTATATQRVRNDIIQLLKLRNPAVFVSSFFRQNLHYRVEAKSNPTDHITGFIRRRAGQSGIVYCASRAATERLASALEARGIPAKPYHAGLSADQRALHQDLFIRDEIPVICATIAFGMGINKPNVRWVIHHDLPKNMEGYYQETGRAGRDGLVSECVLLFSPGDVAKQSHFLEEISDEQEQAAARAQLRRMVAYAETGQCRWKDLLAYFGETLEGPGCGYCDNCKNPRSTYDATIPAQKFLSCVYRIGSATRFSTGMNHIIDVLHGLENEKMLRWGHHRLTTFGIGRDLTRGEWSSIGRELLQLGLLEQSAGRYPTVAITSAGLLALKSRQVIHLTQPLASGKSGRSRKKPAESMEMEGDALLFDKFRALRKHLADERKVPAYVILGDATLRAMCASLPASREDLSAIPGWGEKKLEQFSAAFLRVIADHRTR